MNMHKHLARHFDEFADHLGHGHGHGREHEHREEGGSHAGFEGHPGHPMFRHHMPPGGPDRRGRRRGAGRAPKGDVRSAILLLLAAEGPMHGYQLMQAISDRSGGRWVPSPGAIYPAISQLEDEGLVSVNAEAGRKLVTLTDTGRAAAEVQQEGRADPFASFGDDRPGTDLRDLVVQVHSAVREVFRTGTDAQVVAATDILRSARRSLYLLLAQDPNEDAQ